MKASPKTDESANSNIIQYIPNITLQDPTQASISQNNRPVNIQIDIYTILAIALLAGIIFMLIKFLIQLVSYQKFKRNARLISNDSINIYQVDKEIVPFSFGNSIFINQDLHDENSLQEILQHEFVHIKQKHTLDILWGEFITIINWYNPFVWLIRKAIRENLEYIADDKVVQSGIDKQQYQYLLLRVMGNNHFSITNNFNFSSLKKRIAMMNKIKSAKIHLLKFLFLIPLIGVLLISFRDEVKTDEKRDSVTISGIVVDVENKQPLKDVMIRDSANHVQAITDEKGFYTIKIYLDSTNTNHSYRIKFSKKGFKEMSAGSSSINKEKNEYSIANVELQIGNTGSTNLGSIAFQSIEKEADYQTTKIIYQQNVERANLVNKLIKEGKIVSIQKNALWIVGENCSATYNSVDYKIYVDGKLMTPEEINSNFSPKQIDAISSKNDTTIDIRLNH